MSTHLKPGRFARPHAMQRGSILIATIFLVLMLTILGIGAMSLNTTQTRIATNTADSQTAFQTAEGALTEAQAILTVPNYDHKSFPIGNAGYYAFTVGNAPTWTTIDWTGNTAAVSFQGKAKNPGYYIIEQLGVTPIVGTGTNPKNGVPQPVNWNYRITSRAFGASGGPMVMLQATVQIQGDQ
jgi:type IV pilus assembly protein PilX